MFCVFLLDRELFFLLCWIVGGYKVRNNIISKIWGVERGVIKLISIVYILCNMIYKGSVVFFVIKLCKLGFI